MTPVYDIQPPLELLKKGKAAEAIPMLEFIASEMPSHVSCHVLLAQAYAEEERWQEALSSWQNASFLMPNSPAIRKGFRDVLHILSRQTIKLIATAPEPDTVEDQPLLADQAVAEEESAIHESFLDELIGGDSALEVAENELEPSVDSQPAESEASAGADTEVEDAEVEDAVVEDAEVEEAAVADLADMAAEDDKSIAEAADTEAADTEAADTEAANPETAVPEQEEEGATEPAGKTSGYTPRNIFASKVPPTLAHLAADPESISEDLELDDLIQELETARIVPKPEHEIIEAPVLEADIDDMVSETLARIYEGQKQFGEAARVYEKLAVMQPDRAAHFKQRATELRARAEGSDAV